MWIATLFNHYISNLRGFLYPNHLQIIRLVDILSLIGSYLQYVNRIQILSSLSWWHLGLALTSEFPQIMTASIVKNYPYQ